MNALSHALLAPLLLAATAVPASAQAPYGPPAPDRNSLTLGIGGGIAPEYEGSGDYGFQPGGVIQGKVDGFDFQVRGTNIYVDLIRDADDSKLNLILGPVAQIRLERTSRSDLDDPRVALLGTRETAVELGGHIGIGKKGFLIPPASLTFDLSFVHDVAGAHDSFILSPGLSLSSPVSQRTFARLGVSADYVGAGYGRTYFDVPALATPGALPAYATDGAGFKSIGTTLLLTHDLGGDNRKGWGLFALTGYKRLLGQYSRSPIVRDAGNADQFLAVAGIAYSF
ncbi:MipA/OmpV family protein [Sphingorhabdus pulchriflava]|uniref:MipA/OmpV family protein n=1 Tax=Sphingorhabdus pulchriflava TaxID=2292257 RepID=A0A371BJ98_9SPHN|nr:MipA/OmpV family protein [Sphingorhabdus pulchriflava]RDV07645.1 MipA/OmpV family protein [Sphingorhabdus pulchriflava]